MILNVTIFKGFKPMNSMDNRNLLIAGLALLVIFLIFSGVNMIMDQNSDNDLLAIFLIVIAVIIILILAAFGVKEIPGLKIKFFL